jgi:hypothetical protein
LLVKNGCYLLAEASNMGCTAEAAEYLTKTIKAMLREKLLMRAEWLFQGLKCHKTVCVFPGRGMK